MITLGERKLHTHRPADLDEKLVAATGCNAAEHAAMLDQGGTAFHVAQALGPMLRDPVPVGELAASIDDEVLPGARHAVAKLLRAEPVAEKAS